MFGEAAFLVFGEDEGVIQFHLEGAAAGGDEFQAFNTLFVFIQHLFRQTDGFGQVASRRAVFDAQSSFVSHGVHSFAAYYVFAASYVSRRTTGVVRLPAVARGPNGALSPVACGRLR